MSVFPWSFSELFDDCQFVMFCLQFIFRQVVISGEWQKVMHKVVRWPCCVCSRGVGNNSIQCPSCQKWVHRKCSGIKGSMYKVMKSFICRGCMIPVTGTGCTSVPVDIGVNANLELVDKFCYLGYMFVECGWRC